MRIQRLIVEMTNKTAKKGERRKKSIQGKE
jgi:hypothetical protein